MANIEKYKQRYNSTQSKHRNLKTKQHKPYFTLGVISGAPEGKQNLLHTWRSSYCSC